MKNKIDDSSYNHTARTHYSPEILKKVMSFGFVAKEYASHLEKKRTALLQLDDAIARKRATGIQKWMKKLLRQDMTVDGRYFALLKATIPGRQELIRRDFLRQQTKLEQMLLYYGFRRENLPAIIIIAEAINRRIKDAIIAGDKKNLLVYQQVVRMPLEEFQTVFRQIRHNFSTIMPESADPTDFAVLAAQKGIEVNGTLASLEIEDAKKILSGAIKVQGVGKKKQEVIERVLGFSPKTDFAELADQNDIKLSKPPAKLTLAQAKSLIASQEKKKGFGAKKKKDIWEVLKWRRLCKAKTLKPDPNFD
jgi:hypothetical protein